MRLVSFSIMILLGLWVIAGMPVPGVAVKPMSPNPELPTFAEAARKLPNANRVTAVQEAVRMGRVEQDPEMRRLRQRLLDRAERLKQDPCNTEVRKKFAAAAIPFLEAMRGERSFPEETAKISGKTVSVAKEFNKPIYRAIEDALIEGRLKADDIPDRLNFIGRQFTGAMQGLTEHFCQN